MMRLPASGRRARAVAGLLALGTGLLWWVSPSLAPAASTEGINPHPILLRRPPEAPLSLLASVGQRLFFDRSLSASGQQSCSSCHSRDNGFGPPDGRSVQLGGPDMDQAGLRPPPSLAYLYRQEPFSIGPAMDDSDTPVPLATLAAQAQGVARPVKAAGAVQGPALVPQGGLFWDGRASTLMDQATGPLTNPVEMANRDRYAVARKLVAGGYREALRPLFGRAVDAPDMLYAEAMSALARYQVESRAFHRFDSRYDAWLEGRGRLTPAELRGMRLFNDPAKGNCAACHPSQPGADGLPPLFTDTEYEALGVPRNPAVPANRDPRFFDMGLCGPLRTDLARQTRYCGMFLTPTLRNAARRGVYFHNGVYHTLRQVLLFYNLRETNPGRIYARDRHGRVLRYDDLPVRYHANIDRADAPFDRQPGGKAPLTDAEIDDILAFIGTLNDGAGLEDAGGHARPG